MGTIDSKKLNQALVKAKNVGVVELACTISGCDLVLRSLRSEDYTAALRDCEGLPEEAYIPHYQKGHVARSIVEVNGVDLRDTQFVTVDEQDKSGVTKKVKLEVHKYLMDHMLNTWGKEAVDVAFRKMGEVLEMAERRAREGVTFITPDETTEEQYRRLLLEARAAEKDLPASLLDKILEEQGLMRKSTAEEIKRAMDRTAQLAREQEGEQVDDTPVAPPPESLAPSETAVSEELETLEPHPPEPPPKPRPPVPDPHVTLQQAMAARRPQPEVQSEQKTEAKPSTRRADQIAALEGSSGMPADISSAVSLQHGSDDVVELRKAPIDPQAASLIVDNPPVVGINPRFRPPQRV